MSVYNLDGDGEVIDIASDGEDEVIEIPSDGEDDIVSIASSNSGDEANEGIESWVKEPEKGKSGDNPVALDCVSPIEVDDKDSSPGQRRERSQTKVTSNNDKKLPPTHDVCPHCGGVVVKRHKQVHMSSLCAKRPNAKRNDSCHQRSLTTSRKRKQSTILQHFSRTSTSTKKQTIQTKVTQFFSPTKNRANATGSSHRATPTNTRVTYYESVISIESKHAVGSPETRDIIVTDNSDEEEDDDSVVVFERTIPATSPRTNSESDDDDDSVVVSSGPMQSILIDNSPGRNDSESLYFPVSDIANADDRATTRAHCSAEPACSLSNGDEERTLDEFVGLLGAVETKINKRTIDLDEELKKATFDTSGQNLAQYGRLLPAATESLLREHLQLEKSDIFIDIGSGMGNAPLQATCTIGCESRGIELSPGRHEWAKKFKAGFEREGVDASRCHLQCGRMEAAEHREFLRGSGNKVVKMLCNNFNDNFGEKAMKNGQYYSLNSYVAGLFSSLAPGSKLVTLDKLDMFMPSLDDIRKRASGETRQDDSASFYTVRKTTLGKQNECVSWSMGSGCDKPLEIYVYTRIGAPSFRCLCRNELLDAYKIVLVKEGENSQERLVQNSCRDCNQPWMQMRQRSKKVCYDENRDEDSLRQEE